MSSRKSRTTISTGAPWELTVGYCRAVRVGSHVSVSGTAPVGADGEVVGVGDAYAQACRCIEIIEGALNEAGASLEDVVRTRIFVQDINNWEAVARAHGVRFAQIRPANTLVEAKLVGAPYLVEIEADAIAR